MLRKIATALGYAKAPKTTLVLKHPVKGTKALLAAKGGKMLLKSRAGAVLGAIVAVPLVLFARNKVGGGAERDGDKGKDRDGKRKKK